MEDRPTTIRVYPGELRPVYYTSVLASPTTTTLEVYSGTSDKGPLRYGRLLYKGHLLRHHANTLVCYLTSEIGTTSLQGTKLLAPKCPLFGGSTVYCVFVASSASHEKTLWETRMCMCILWETNRMKARKPQFITTSATCTFSLEFGISHKDFLLL